MAAITSIEDAELFLDSASEAETLEYLQGIAEALDYDFGNIHFDSMPDYVGGYTETDYQTDESGHVVINSQDIYLNERLLEDEEDEEWYDPFFGLFGGGGGSAGIDFYDETQGLLDTFYHELIHGKQYRDIWQSDEPYTEDEVDALRFLHEGQAAYNADTDSYRDAQSFYEQFLDSTEAGLDAADALEDLSEQYRVDVLHMESADGEQIYDFVITDRDDAVSTEELYELAEDAYGMTVDRELSREIDYREFNAEKLGGHVLRVQDQIQEGYGEVLADAGEDALPAGYNRSVEYTE